MVCFQTQTIQAVTFDPTAGNQIACQSAPWINISLCILQNRQQGRKVAVVQPKA